MSEPWLLLNSGPCPAAWNMAVDEALLLAAPDQHPPVLRFYGWTEPAATFGYFQKFADVSAMTPLRPLIRRPTGGGLVPHNIDWTYSVVFPASHSWYSLRAEESYRQLHEWLNGAFSSLNVSSMLAPCCAKELPGRCFAGPEKSDLVLDGRKIAGAAQRRSKTGLLIQGSVHPPAGTERQAWQTAVCEEAARRFDLTFETMEPGNSLVRQATDLARTKYALDAFNQRR